MWVVECTHMRHTNPMLYGFHLRDRASGGIIERVNGTHRTRAEAMRAAKKMEKGNTLNFGLEKPFIRYRAVRYERAQQ